MLVLSRYTDESVRIGEDVEVMVVEVRGDRVRLGIVAPKNVEILRSELLPRKTTNQVPRHHFNGDEPLEC